MTSSEYSSLLVISTRKAHEALFEEYYNYVRTIVFNRLRSTASSEDVEECISDVFAEVFFSFSDKYDFSDMKIFIGTIAKRKSIDHYKKLTRRSVTSFSLDDDSLTELSSDEDVASNSEKKELRHILIDCIKALGEPDSTIVIQKFYYNMNSMQIGKLIGMKPSSVRMRCKRAAEKLKKLLEEKGIQEDAI